MRYSTVRAVINGLSSISRCQNDTIGRRSEVMSRLLRSMSKFMLNVNAALGEIGKPNGTMELC